MSDKSPEEVAVEEQAANVRALKTAKAPKEAVDEAVAELKKRKAALEASKPPASKEAAAAPAEAAPAPAPTEPEDLSQYFSSALAISNSPSGLSPQERFDLVASVAEECIERSELA